MKLPILPLTGAILLGGVATVMAVTNPSPEAYETYAAQRLTEYLTQETCAKAPTLLGTSLRDQCLALVKSAQPQMKQIIANSTKRDNFLLFSIYKTDLSLGTVLPSYHFETVAIFQTFHPYKTEQK